MANPTVRIRRHASGSAPGAFTLLNAELAFDENGLNLWYGYGISTGVNSAMAVAVGGSGSFTTLGSTQTITGAKTFTGGVDFSSSVQGSVKSVTPIATSNGTDISTTGWVRGFAQPLNGMLTAVAGAATTGLIAITSTGSPAISPVTLTGASSNARITVTNGNGVAGNPTFDLTAVTVTGSGPKPTVDGYGRVTSLSTLANTDITAGGGYLAAGGTLTGAATYSGVTISQFDNTQTLVTSSWVNSTGLGVATTIYNYTGATQAIPASNAGALVTYTGTTASTFTLPLASTTGIIGATYVISNESNYVLTVLRSGSDSTTEGNTITMNPGERIALVSDHVSAWHSLWRTNYGNPTFSGNVAIAGNLSVTGTTSFTGAVTMPVPNLPSQTANTFFAAPSGSAGAPTFRALVPADLPLASGSTIAGAVIVGAGLTNTSGTISANVLSVATLTGAITAAALTAQLTTLAPLASPSLTGVPLAPTPANGTNTTQIATTAFVLATRHDQIAAPTNAVSWGNQALTNLLDPVNPQDAATKNYVDAARNGLAVKTPVRALANVNITVSNPATAVFDGVTLATGDRVLLVAQTTASQNGIYIFNGSASAMTRSSDANGVQTDQSGAGYGTLAEGTFVFVGEGTTWKSTGWVLQTPGSTATGAIVVGTTSLTFVQFSGTGDITFGNGFTQAGNNVSLNVSANFGFTAGVLNLVSVPTTASSTITTLGTITAGVWNGTALTPTYGGLGNISASTGFVLLTSGAVSFVPSINPATQITYNSGSAPVTAATAFAAGLGDMAGQLSNNVAITGGAISGIVLDCGTF